MQGGGESTTEFGRVMEGGSVDARRRVELHTSAAAAVDRVAEWQSPQMRAESLSQYFEF